MQTQPLQRVEAISREVDITAFHRVSMKICHKIVTNFLLLIGTGLGLRDVTTGADSAKAKTRMS